MTASIAAEKHNNLLVYFLGRCGKFYTEGLFPPPSLTVSWLIKRWWDL